ncbi:RepB family plasmid replication initiator protein [Coxiella burnetii]|uniref:Initiator Rep protein WH1 domain-containing protein n=1 Tax=Coxiella burnetii (strain Dugway 5J108-111) TaxID=434922 RepID=A9KCY2_COXBN|nr:replication initiation protein [Coxiella burnetii]ABS77142.1 hypothetical protein CBUD_1802 [Coxiella burnetii Dugway 5J108-111]OYK79667.1 RepB family plasmid replication initiator protein [Coxiella burnetii]OYK81752.1 RepB family plasmid replication initiator protein [Coxiella burnetii]
MPKTRKRPDIGRLLLSSPIALTLSDRRLYNYLLHNALDVLSKRLSFTISMTGLAGVYGVRLPPIDRLKESLRRLMRTLIEYETAPGKWTTISLLDKAELDETEGQLYYCFSVDCRWLYSDPFTLERCLIQAHFIQKYTHSLYELLASAHYAGQSTLSIEIMDLRGSLQISDNKLINYSDLDRFALIPAVKEINAYASFAVKYHTQRKGMKVTKVIFEMTTKRNIAFAGEAKQVLPPKRPRLFIDNPDSERAYAYILNAQTKERRRFFELAKKRALKQKQKIQEEAFDRPDLWFRWIENELLKAAVIKKGNLTC